jgi:AcrR family transcriptional regulator
MDKARDSDPPPSRRKSRDDTKRETREALIAAGISAFAVEGLDAPSLDSICARAGYTRGAFYVHFKDRDDFLMAVMTNLLEGFLDSIIATGDAALDLQKTIDTFVGAVEAKAFPIQGGLHFHQFMAACARSPRIRERFVQVLEEASRRVAIAVKEGQGAGTVRADVSPEAVGLILVGIVLGVESLLVIHYSFDVAGAAKNLSRVLRP